MTNDDQARSASCRPRLSPDVLAWVSQEAAKDRRKHPGEWVGLLVEAAYEAATGGTGAHVRVGGVEVRKARRS